MRSWFSSPLFLNFFLNHNAMNWLSVGEQHRRSYRERGISSETEGLSTPLTLNIITSVIQVHCTLCLFLAVCAFLDTRTHTHTHTHTCPSAITYTDSQVAILCCLFWVFSLLLFIIGGADDRGDRGQEEEEEEVRQLSLHRWCGVVSWVEVGNPSSVYLCLSSTFSHFGVQH